MSNHVLHCQDRFERAIEELIQGGDLKDRIKNEYHNVWALKNMPYLPKEYLVHFKDLERNAVLLGLYQKNNVN